MDRLETALVGHSASMVIAPGVNVKALSTSISHSNISLTMDRYGHLMPGKAEEAGGLLDSQARIASLS